LSENIRIKFSPDSDDLFMFYALINKKIDTKKYNFIYELEDTEELNRSALVADSVDITAISVHNYAYLASKYMLLPHGGSVGNNYGPVLIANQACKIESLYKDKIIAVPGLKTTAYLVLRLILKHFKENIVPIAPFHRIFEVLKSNQVDAGLIIHEGRLTYETEGFYKILDIGEWWYADTKMPLPLGANIINKRLGMDKISEISDILRKSIRYALDHKEESISYIIKNDKRQLKELDNRRLIEKYLSMYANEETFNYSNEGRAAIKLLLDRGYEEGIIPQKTIVEFAP
jgi:1,4-dihydroxy-6-naphthoate synthase